MKAAQQATGAPQRPLEQGSGRDRRPAAALMLDGEGSTIGYQTMRSRRAGKRHALVPVCFTVFK